MPKINRRHFIVGAAATGAYLTTHSWSAVSSLAQTATRTFSGGVTIPEGFTVPAGETWEFDPNTSTTVVVEKNVVVHGTLRMRPSSASVVHTLRFESVDETKFVGGGMEVLDTDVGLWVMGFGRLDLQGSPRTAWNRTGWDPSWLPSDEVRIAPTAKGDFGSDGFALYKQGDPVPSIEIPGVRTWSFTDIASSPFADDIEAIYAAGITSGYGDGRFGPNDGVTRAQMAAFLVRGLDLAAAGSAGFSDVAGHWAEDAINRLAAAGITTGYPDGRFGPNDGVTRGQMAAFLVRALDLATGDPAGFTDVSGHWAEDAINRLAAAGITSGYGDGRFGPNDGVTRGQMAAFLRRALTLSAPTASGGASLGSEVLNLTRNVLIEGTDTGRAHVLIHSAVPQVIQSTEIRHVGPQQSGKGILGRYGLHFHHCGDGSRGSVVEGVVIAEAGFHAFVPHMSNGVTFSNCISYDTTGEAYWWDPGDPSHDIAWQSCVAALVDKEPASNGYRLAGFVHGAGEGSSTVDCVAVGIQGRDDSSGFLWPESSGGVWHFTQCIAHNNKENGIFTWQNSDNVHVVQEFIAYRNGNAGIKHGAYVNRYVYRDSTIVDSLFGLVVVAHSKGEPPLVFSAIDISDCTTGVLLAGTNFDSDVPTKFESLSIRGASDKVRIAADPSRDPRYDFFVRCGLEPDDVTFQSAAAGSKFVFERVDGSSWSMDGSGAVV